MPTIPLIIKIHDYRYSTNITVPTAVTPIDTTPIVITPIDITPIDITPIDITPIEVLPTKLKIVRMLPEDTKKLPDVYDGETVNITATVVCKTDNVVSRPKDTAYLIIDGVMVDRKYTENGIVTFGWEATTIPKSLHTICIKVYPSTGCESPGQDCKKLTVSTQVLSIQEQLKRERTAYTEQQRLIDTARGKLRDEIIGAVLIVPGEPITEPITVPITTPITVPITTPITVPITTPVTVPVTVPEPDYGNIAIVGLPGNLPFTQIPVTYFIDNELFGTIYKIPTVIKVPIGTHTVHVESGNITSLTQTVLVKKNETINITL